MTPYQNVAKAALMNWNGLTEEQANQKIQTESVQELGAEPVLGDLLALRDEGAFHDGDAVAQLIMQLATN